MAIKVTQTRSQIGTRPKQRGTLRALGLRCWVCFCGATNFGSVLQTTCARAWAKY